MTEYKDYVILPDGRLVFAAAFLLARGYCCGCGCINCPYNYENVPDSKKQQLLYERQQAQSKPAR